jgi:hypothetical protein
MRRVTSLLLVAIFVLLAVTGVWMAHGHHGPRPGPPATTTPMSSESDAAAAAAGAVRRAPPFFPRGLHEGAGYALIVAVPLHLVFNYTRLLNHCGLRKRKQS